MDNVLSCTDTTKVLNIVYGAFVVLAGQCVCTSLSCLTCVFKNMCVVLIIILNYIALFLTLLPLQSWLRVVLAHLK